MSAVDLCSSSKSFEFPANFGKILCENFLSCIKTYVLNNIQFYTRKLDFTNIFCTTFFAFLASEGWGRLLGGKSSSFPSLQIHVAINILQTRGSTSNPINAAIGTSHNKMVD